MNTGLDKETERKSRPCLLYHAQKVLLKILKRHPFLLEHNIHTEFIRTRLCTPICQKIIDRYRNPYDMLWHLCARHSLTNWPLSHIVSREPGPEVWLTLSTSWKWTSNFHKLFFLTLPDKPVRIRKGGIFILVLSWYINNWAEEAWVIILDFLSLSDLHQGKRTLQWYSSVVWPTCTFFF